jgi:hypothetical protein
MFEHTPDLVRKDIYNFLDEQDILIDLRPEQAESLIAFLTFMVGFYNAVHEDRLKRIEAWLIANFVCGMAMVALTLASIWR